MSSQSQLPVELTVGYVAGIVAAAIVVAQLFCPAALTYVLAGLLRDTETASTWTVASANLLSSIWPTILRTDSAGNGGRVRTGINIVSKSLPLMALLCAITGVVTPLGLGEELMSLPETPGTFEYFRDTSPYGLGTSPRGQHVFSRICDGEHQGRSVVAACPYSNSEVIVEGDNDGFTVRIPNGYNASVPDLAREIFSSGTSDASTLSNFFDIEWRQLTSKERPELGNGEYSVGMFRQLDSFILDNSYKLVEGLVIDAKVGGIGFRNHTIPVGLDRGATWEEDLLFIEPSTACINTNLTLDFQITTNGSHRGGVRNVMLTDRGGFAELNTTYPQYDHPNAQSNPDLLGRAYKAAWVNNAMNMLYFNVTNENDPDTGADAFSYVNSEVGQEFEVSYASYDDFDGLSLSNEFGNYLHLGTSRTTLMNSANYSNPFNISRADFATIPVLCSGAGRDDLANISNIYVGCGLLRGAPQRTDGGPTLLFDNGGKWSSPLHACAATVRTTIKTVSFAVNGTDLDSLVVLSIKPKTYASENDAPLWGMEDSGFRLEGLAPIWGLLAEEYASRENVSTVQKPEFYLAGYSTGTDPPSLMVGSTQQQNLPAATFAQHAMNTVFQITKRLAEWPFDLRGTASMAIFRRWQTLSSDPTRAAEIINLMWTDLAASAVVGTRGVQGPGNSGETSAQVLVRPIGNRITYDLRFSIPACLLVGSMGVILLTALGSTCCGRGSFKTLRRRIGQLSVGRVFTTFLHPEESTLTMLAKEWRLSNGRKTITVNEVAKRGAEQYMYTRSGDSPGVDTINLIGGQKGR